MLDASLENSSDDRANGVTPQLVRNVREALNDAGFNKVLIVASGGFNAEKISGFEAEGVPVDAYGVGSAFMRGNFDFTADVVKINGKPMAKVGREYSANDRLLERTLSPNKSHQ